LKVSDLGNSRRRLEWTSGPSFKAGIQLSKIGKPTIDLNALIVFAKVVEAKSFSEAARRLGMPVSTVSRRVAELEDQLGVRLLDRSTRTSQQRRSLCCQQYF
jgi:molybdenum-dependent DNA-binding transcriptional regulator ModE